MALKNVKCLGSGCPPTTLHCWQATVKLPKSSQPTADNVRAHAAAAKECQQPNTDASSYWQPIHSFAYYAAGTLKPACGFYHHTSRIVGSLSNSIQDAYSTSHSKIGSWNPDPDCRAFAAASLSVAYVALDEASRLVPSGHSICRVVKAGSSEFSRSYRGEGREKAEKQVERRLREVERELSELRKWGRVRVEGVELGREEKVGGVVEFAKPEDVIKAFVKEGFKGRDWVDMIVVPKVCVGHKEEVWGKKRKVVDGGRSM